MTAQEFQRRLDEVKKLTTEKKATEAVEKVTALLAEFQDHVFRGLPESYRPTITVLVDLARLVGKLDAAGRWA